MNYRHAFHAGGFADVVKHVALVELMRLTTGKEKPLLLLDTHAGAGAYDLADAPALRGAEAPGGVLAVMTQAVMPAPVRRYVEAVQAYDRYCGNRGNGLAHYPGSPRLMRSASRASDRVVLCELEPTQALRLRREFAGDRRVDVRAGDGFEIAPTLLPPPERRGIVLIDPAYERREDWQRASRCLAASVRRFGTGIFALWYPIKSDGASANLIAELSRLDLPKTLSLVLHLVPAQPSGRSGRRPPLLGCGLVVVNPPWGFEAAMRETLPWLGRMLGGARAGEVSWLVPERGAKAATPLPPSPPASTRRQRPSRTRTPRAS